MKEEAQLNDGANAFSLDLQMNTHEGRSSEVLADVLETIAVMIRGGIVHDHSASMTKGVDFHYTVMPSFAEGIYIDGEGMVVAVDDDGDIMGIVRPDGTDDDSPRHLPMDAFMWAHNHGGMMGLKSAAKFNRIPTPEQMEFLNSMLNGEHPADCTCDPEEDDQGKK